MTKEELNFIGSMNMCDEISNEAYKKIVCHCREQEPCEDAVPRQAVLALAKEECDTAIIPYRKFVKDVNALQPVTPQPKIGHWIGDKAYPICPKCNCNIIEEYISCSDYAEIYKPMKYCPNCGAKMVEPQESEDKE